MIKKIDLGAAMGGFAQAGDAGFVYGELANGAQVKLKKSDLASMLGELMCYSGWVYGNKMKITKGSCSFILATHSSSYLITATGSKGADVTRLGGYRNDEFKEDSSGNVYVLVSGMYFIQKIGHDVHNIIAEIINDYPSDCTTLVIK